MRKHQISVSIYRVMKTDETTAEDVSTCNEEQSKVLRQRIVKARRTRKAHETKSVSVYADANNFYEALCAAYNETVMEIQRVGGFTEMSGWEKENCSNEIEAVITIAYSELLNPAFSSAKHFSTVSNNVFEALALAFNSVLYEVQKLVDLPTFGRKEHYGDPSGNKDTILDFQFTNAEGLTGPDVTIPEGYLYVLPEAFRGRDDIESITIPEGVTKIYRGAFEDCTNLKSVNLPESITSISNYVFKGCKSLTHIELPTKIDAIYGMTFHGCESLRKVVLPDGLQKIYGAFEYCTSLEEIRIPAGVVEISDDAFRGCSALKSIFVDAENTEYSDLDGVLFNKDGTVLLRYPEGKVPSDEVERQRCYAIPSGVTEVGHDAFSGCRHIEVLDIPASLTKISHVAFRVDKRISYNGETPAYQQNYDGVRHFTVDSDNDAYSDIDAVLFNKDGTILIKYPKGCPETEYIVPDGTTEILYSAFADCINLETVILPESLTKIGGFAFQDCTGLTHIAIPESVKEIERGCFWGCDNLAQIEMKAQDIALGECRNEYAAWLNSQPDGVVYLGNVAIKYKGEMPDGCVIKIKEGTRRIAPSAFDCCHKLTGVEIPESVVEIGDYAFHCCSKLTDVVIKGSNVKIAETAFEHTAYGRGSDERKSFANRYFGKQGE